MSRTAMPRTATIAGWTSALAASCLLHALAFLSERVSVRRATAAPLRPTIEVTLQVEPTPAAAPVEPRPVEPPVEPPAARESVNQNNTQPAEPPPAAAAPVAPALAQPEPSAVEPKPPLEPSLEPMNAEPAEAASGPSLATAVSASEPVAGSRDQWVGGRPSARRAAGGLARRASGGSRGSRGARLTPLSDLSRPPSPRSDMRALLQKNTPEKARRLGLEGQARVAAVILPSGHVGALRVLAASRDAAFGAACVKTLRASKWRPPLDRQRRAVAVRIVYQCHFVVVD